MNRLKGPLLLQMGSGSVEMSYAILSHIYFLVQRAPNVFVQDSSFKQFFCRDNDPVCVKQIKLNILTDLATESSMSEILNELSEYVSDDNLDISRSTIQAIGKIAFKV